jgi:uncharacterized protein YkwD
VTAEHLPRPFRLVAGALLLSGVLGACSMMAGGGGALAPGLTARMDQPGATLDRAQVLGMVNQFRAASGAAPVTDDPSLDAAAQALVAQYVDTGSPPRQPAGTVMRTSAGYPTFAETFSGWRATPADASALADRSARRAGIATRYSAASGYGVYWVLLLAP